MTSDDLVDQLGKGIIKNCYLYVSPRLIPAYQVDELDRLFTELEKKPYVFILVGCFVKNKCVPSYAFYDDDDLLSDVDIGKGHRHVTVSDIY
ncbi:unnamed protein product [Absidia cylindrospora]